MLPRPHGPASRVQLLPDHGQSRGDGFELIRVGQTLIAEPLGKEAADRRHQRGAAGEEDTLDLALTGLSGEGGIDDADDADLMQGDQAG